MDKDLHGMLNSSPFPGMSTSKSLKPVNILPPYTEKRI